MMSVQKSYNKWADQYDSNVNKTRDLEAFALQEVLKDADFKNVLEMGCGTGKNTTWILTKAERILAADISEEMLLKSRGKITDKKVEFIQFDMLKEWNFPPASFDLITFSLVLEHIEHIDIIIQNAIKFLAPGGRLYIGELHPQKQYTGSQAKFETEKGMQLVDCFVHHISDFVQPAIDHGMILEKCTEWFDEGHQLPRILTLLFRNNGSNPSS